MNKRLSLALLSASILTACGGGSGGGKSPTPELIRIDSSYLVADENSSINVPINSSASDLAFEVISQVPSDIGVLSLQGNDLKATFGETDRPGAVTAKVYSREKGIDHPTSKLVTISVQNTSAAALEEQARQVLEQKNDILSLKEDQIVFKFLLDLAYLNDVITYGQKTSYIDGFNPTDPYSYVTLANDYANFESQHQSYLSGDKSDTSLSSNLSDVEQSIVSHADFAKTQFSNIKTLSDPFISDLTATDMEYDPISNRYSRFIGQSSLGAYSGSEWSFLSGYQLLDYWVPKNANDNFSTCEAVN